MGTGPYRVAANTRHQLCLQAFDDYFGYRALLDQVDIWMMPELGEQLEHGNGQVCGLEVRINPREPSVQTEMALESGVYFLLADGRSPRLHDAALRDWLAQTLAPLAVIQETAPAVRQYWAPAAGLLPNWHHAQPALNLQPPDGLSMLRLAYYEQHPEYQLIAAAMARCLRPHGVELECRALPYADWEQGHGEADLWLGSVNFATRPEYSVAAWVLGTLPLRRCLESALPLTQWQQGWRQGLFRAQDLSAAVVQQRWMLPLFHNWLRLRPGPDARRAPQQPGLVRFQVRLVAGGRLSICQPVARARREAGGGRRRAPASTCSCGNCTFRFFRRNALSRSCSRDFEQALRRRPPVAYSAQIISYKDTLSEISSQEYTSMT